MNQPQQKAKGTMKGLKTIKFMKYQEENKQRKEKLRNLKRKLKKVINTVPCKILRKISKKCNYCPIFHNYQTKTFVDLWLDDDFPMVVWVNCEYDKIIRLWLRIFWGIK